MIAELFVALVLGGEVAAAPPADPAVALMLHTYEVKFRLDGRVSTTEVKANDAGHAKKLVQAQYGPQVTVLSVKRVSDRSEPPAHWDQAAASLFEGKAFSLLEGTRS